MEYLFGVNAVVTLLASLALALMLAAMQRTAARARGLHARFERLSNHAKQGIVVLDSKRILYANPAVLAIFGFENFEQLRQAGPWSKESPWNNAQGESMVEALMAGERAFHGVERASRRVDGTPIQVHFSGWLADWDGAPAVHVMLTDMTGKHQAAQALARLEQEREAERAEHARQVELTLKNANAELEVRVVERTRELEAANQAKSRFLATMSHEIRTPMNAVLGMLQLLESSGLNTAQQEYASKAMGAAKSLLSILNDILDFSKMEAGKMVLELRPFQLRQVQRDMSVVLQAALHGSAVALVFDVDAQVPDLLCGDAMRIQQVLINLGSNAIKFTPQGEVRICIRTVAPATGAKPDLVTLEFSVQDSGIGIAAEHQQSIFEAFTQAEANTTRRFGGTGLGLAISKRLVEAMGSQLRVCSQPGMGSCFSFQLTLPKVAAPESIAPPVTSAPPGERLRGLRVLLVEDNPVNQQVATLLLRKEGAEVCVAANGQLGVAAVAQAATPFDAVLMDIQMPVMDGYAATREIRGTLGCTRLPIVALSANAQRADRDQALASGMDDHVGKPFDMAQLCHILLGLHHRVPCGSAPRFEATFAVQNRYF